MDERELKNIMKDNSISMSKFLINYCGLYNDDMHKSQITHKDIKQLLPYIKRIGFEELIDNITLLYNGDIISVIDSSGNVAPYVNPRLSDPIQTYDCILEDTTISLPSNINVLSIEELKKISKRLKSQNNYREYRGVKKLIKTRTSPIKDYKNKKSILKGIDENDEY